MQVLHHLLIPHQTPQDDVAHLCLYLRTCLNMQITFFGLEKLHPFDSTKYRNVLALLRRTGTVPDRRHIVRAPEAALSTLADVHSPSYLQSLERSSLKVAQVTELSPLAAIPAALLRRRVLCPMRTMAGGSVVAGALALERGWAMNLGGGMHHAHYHDGSGWCAYDDITLMLRSLREASGGLFSQAMIIGELTLSKANFCITETSTLILKHIDFAQNFRNE